MSIRKKRLLGVILLLIIIGCIASAAFLYVRWANSPVAQPIYIDHSANELPASNKTTPLKTSLFETRIPTSYRVRTSPPTTTPTLYHVSAFEQATGGTQIAITYGPLVGTYEDMPGYKYRVTYPEKYTPVTLPYFSGSPAFQTAQGEITVFVKHASMFVSIAVTSPGSDTTHSKRILSLLDTNWKWLQ